VQRPALTDWPIWHEDAGNDLQLGTAAPLRHDLTLARYLERQQAWRALAVREFDLSTAAIRACVLVVRVGSAFFRRSRSFRRSVLTGVIGHILCSEKRRKLAPSIEVAQPDPRQPQL